MRSTTLVPLTVSLVFLLVYLNFGRLTETLIVMLSVPFALWSLDVSGNTLNLYSALGILVLFGVVKKNAILQIDQYLDGLIVRRDLQQQEFTNIVDDRAKVQIKELSRTRDLP